MFCFITNFILKNVLGIGEWMVIVTTGYYRKIQLVNVES